MKNRKKLSRRSFGGLALSSAIPSIAASAAEPSREKVRLRILCYNIHYGQGTDGIYDIPRLAAVIKAANPDLVALQEIDVHVKRSGRLHELRMLANETGLKGRFGPTQHYQGGLYGNGILSKFPFHDLHIEPLPYTEATPEKVTYPRAAVAAVISAPDGSRFRFISTHFQHGRFEKDRIAQAKAINARFASDTPKEDVMGATVGALPTILAGDLNAIPGSAPLEIIGKKWTAVVEDEPVPSSPSGAPRNRIDYILYRKADPFRIVEHHVINEPLASDHCPVFAVLELGG